MKKLRKVKWCLCNRKKKNLNLPLRNCCNWNCPACITFDTLWWSPCAQVMHTKVTHASGTKCDHIKALRQKVIARHGAKLYHSIVFSAAAQCFSVVHLAVDIACSAKGLSGRECAEMHHIPQRIVSAWVTLKKQNRHERQCVALNPYGNSVLKSFFVTELVKLWMVMNFHIRKLSCTGSSTKKQYSAQASASLPK